MGAREDILSAARDLAARSHDSTFTLRDVIAELSRRGTAYTESTIRTHVTSRMCANAPDNHGTVHDDLERVDRGRYRLRH
jgi:DNA-binding FadR family transcriptional regulator